MSTSCSGYCCSRGVETADRLAAQGHLRSALLAIDSADDQCQCSRFTQGDAPPEYSAAQTYLRMLVGAALGAEITP